jgi:ubiquinol-cytochrome c reductase cytochrome b subunit
MLRIFKSDILLSLFNGYLLDGFLNYNISYIFNLGSLLGLGIVIQIFSGLFLSFYYVGLLDLSYYSINYINMEVRFGFIFKYLHSVGVSLIFILLYLHIYKSFLHNSYIVLRGVFIVGIIINLFLIIVSFLGYSIAGGSMSYWAVVVIFNLLSVLPYISD